MTQTIRVASYNMRKAVGTDRRRDPERILRIISSLSADIVALQEADRRLPPREPVLDRDQIFASTGLVPVAFDHGRNSLGWHGNALLIRPDFEILDRSHFDLKGGEPRGGVSVSLVTDLGMLRVFGIHLGLLRGTRRRQLSALKAASEKTKKPTVVLGDFNERSLRIGLGRMARDYHIRDAGPTYHSRRPVFALDRIAHSHDIRTVSIGRMLDDDARKGSDHLPIFADLDLPTVPAL
ncbi:hypothetical protein B6V73_18020 [Thioclava sp. JM3]|uniref:endonuclease/exonuclease/phosphatase family protein n=1 Tax=Thioclava sp. JM3 TaxID=1973004 RepID=UPI000B541D54|nr:endonuclease/exonuclease/phosphatase family protein [Thioclava sp. JM3]OWY12879.1 hypothetical protein B6V73_18020 [Thioclava sp. JM3]